MVKNTDLQLYDTPFQNLFVEPNFNHFTQT